VEVGPGLSLDEDELAFRAARASGPGGQHVNKTSTAVELRFDVAGSPSLADDVKARLAGLGGSRMTQEGVLVLFAQARRSQELNRQEVTERLFELIRAAAVRPKTRRPTRPTKASKERRLDAKKGRGGIKAARGKPRMDD
jgi:ribosome-associated protein